MCRTRRHDHGVRLQRFPRPRLQRPVLARQPVRLPRGPPLHARRAGARRPGRGSRAAPVLRRQHRRLDLRVDDGRRQPDARHHERGRPRGLHRRQPRVRQGLERPGGARRRQGQRVLLPGRQRLHQGHHHRSRAVEVLRHHHQGWHRHRDRRRGHRRRAVARVARRHHGPDVRRPRRGRQPRHRGTPRRRSRQRRGRHRARVLPRGRRQQQAHRRRERRRVGRLRRHLPQGRQARLRDLQRPHAPVVQLGRRERQAAPAGEVLLREPRPVGPRGRHHGKGALQRDRFDHRGREGLRRVVPADQGDQRDRRGGLHGRHGEGPAGHR